MQYPKWLQERLIFQRPKVSEPSDVPRLKEILYPTRDCEYCARKVQKQTFAIRKTDYGWRISCGVCKSHFLHEKNKRDK